MHTTDDLCLDTRDVKPSKAFGLLKASVVPRPIAWTSTVSTDGVNNLAPFSFFTVVSSEPPMVLLSLEFLDGGRLKDSAANIEATGEFVVNIAPSTYACGGRPDEPVFRRRCRRILAGRSHSRSLPAR